MVDCSELVLAVTCVKPSALSGLTTIAADSALDAQHHMMLRWMHRGPPRSHLRSLQLAAPDCRCIAWLQGWKRYRWHLQALQLVFTVRLCSSARFPSRLYFGLIWVCARVGTTASQHDVQHGMKLRCSPAAGRRNVGRLVVQEQR